MTTLGIFTITFFYVKCLFEYSLCICNANDEVGNDKLGNDKVGNNKVGNYEVVKMLKCIVQGVAKK